MRRRNHASTSFVFIRKRGENHSVLIHSANPKSRPVGIIVFAHVVCSSVRPSPLFKSRKTKLQKTMFSTGVTMGLAEWIIADTCLVFVIFSLDILYKNAHSFCFLNINLEVVIVLKFQMPLYPFILLTTRSNKLKEALFALSLKDFILRTSNSIPWRNEREIRLKWKLMR